MQIFCQERYDEAIKFAEDTNDSSLQQCLERLKSWETNPNCKCEIELYPDFAPYSFLFKQRYENGSDGLIGGLIYHGSPDESFSVQLVPQKGWQIHT